MRTQQRNNCKRSSSRRAPQPERDKGKGRTAPRNQRRDKQSGRQRVGRTQYDLGGHDEGELDEIDLGQLHRRRQPTELPRLTVEHGCNDLRHAVGGEIRRTRAHRQGLKKINGGLASCWVGARWCLGQSLASFWVGRPLQGVPACEPIPWSQHSHDAAGTCTSTVRTRGTW